METVHVFILLFLNGSFGSRSEDYGYCLTFWIQALDCSDPAGKARIQYDDVVFLVTKAQSFNVPYFDVIA
jgi:hypothetical protein